MPDIVVLAQQLEARESHRAAPDLAATSVIGHIRGVRDLPDQPFLDKHRLVGGCVRLGVTIDAARLGAEVAALPPVYWEVRGGKHRYPQQGVHLAAETIFLRGHTPAEGDLPIEDRPALDA